MISRKGLSTQPAPPLPLSGKVVSFEGGDGAGKSTVASSLATMLNDRGLSTKLIRPKHSTFKHDYVAEHMGRISQVLWEGNIPGPRNLFGNLHWVYLSASWFQAVDEHIVQPALKEYEYVVLDSWFHKLLVRFHFKGKDIYDEAFHCFSRLTKPDIIFMLDVSPQVAATRKNSFGYAETGNFDGLTGVNRHNFILYQSQIRDFLLKTAEEDNWPIISVDKLGTHEVLEKILRELLPEESIIDPKQD
jgi:thymidylate kinase